MAFATARFYGELNDFLPHERRGMAVARRFDVSGSVKDFIEGIGIPHTEVDLVIINGEPAPFSHTVHDGDRISVYPAFSSFDVSSVSQVRPPRLPAPRFVLDVHLGRLAAYLRLAGFDCSYSNQASDAELLRLATHEDRALLTRDRRLLMRSGLRWGYWVRSTNAREQLLEVVRRFDLPGEMRPFTRCLKCNGTLEPVGRADVLDRLPPRVRSKERFCRCPGCGAVYWEGTHHERMNRVLDWVKTNVRSH